MDLKPMLNVGLWGYGPSDRKKFINLNRDLEKTLLRLKGMKCLYANTYYSPSAFWSMYDWEWYSKLRSKHHATALPDVYQKVHTAAEAEAKAIRSSWWLLFVSTWPFSGNWGIWCVRMSGIKQLADRSTWKSIEAKDFKEVD